MSSPTWTLCVCLLTCLLRVSVSEVKTVHPGDDVLLLCQAPRGADIVYVKWNRPDLVSEGSVFFFRDDRTDENHQVPYFHGRVKLTDPQMKDGDVSVILENININDTGTYECHVRTKGNSPELISSVQLQVKDSDQQQITVKTGDDVTLQCLDPRGGDIELLEWTRLDSEEDVIVCINRMCTQNNQVMLWDREMKDGDVSVILKNVNVNDAGIYECYVKVRGSRSELISSVHLIVINSGGGAGITWTGSYKGERLYLVIALSVVTVLLAVLVSSMIFRKSKRLLKQIDQVPAVKAPDPEVQDKVKKDDE
ncbi:hypothetical protein Q5P01_002971 [Channa striata]|uniref:Ig-like domain-containing protein n=1 Tax=Channa striata TaxID=64152 RepID=A0AA88P237_CHASR|nr:hypothetical protein Q5P01_002971 [Channa striata]